MIYLIISVDVVVNRIKQAVRRSKSEEKVRVNVSR